MVWRRHVGRKVWTSEDGKALEDYTRSLQPSVILDNRSGYVPPQRKLEFEVANSYGYVFAGDYISPEGEVPPTGLPGIDWETCQTMQLPNNWGYNRLVGFRSFADLLQQLVEVTSKGGNMLLNVGPDADGKLPPQASRCLEKFADWMAVHGESIHGTHPSPFPALPFNGRCTQKPGTLYLHLFDWPKSGKQWRMSAARLAEKPKGPMRKIGFPRCRSWAAPMHRAAGVSTNRCSVKFTRELNYKACSPRSRRASTNFKASSRLLT